MNPQPRISLSRPVALGTGVLLLAGGIVVGLAVRFPGAPSARQPDTRTAVAAGNQADMSVTLTHQAMATAGITVAPVTMGRTQQMLRLPALVEANAYHQVDVTALVTGRVMDVTAAIGDRVTAGQVLARLYSPELAEAETQYVAMMADLEAAHLEVVRLEGLVAVGGASQRRLEQARAEHTAHAAHVETARANLALLGVRGADLAQLHSPDGITPTATLVAPIDGIVTARVANVGLNVDASTKLFTIVDTSTVWVLASAYEQDLRQIRVGAQVSVMMAGAHGVVEPGHVAFIDPQVNPQTRTAQVRIELANQDNRFRLGIYADVDIGGFGGRDLPLLPKTALQTIGERTVVYVTDSATSGRFIERVVRLTGASGDNVAVEEGLAAGELVAVTGTFALRAERERLAAK